MLAKSKYSIIVIVFTATLISCKPAVKDSIKADFTSIKSEIAESSSETVGVLGGAQQVKGKVLEIKNGDWSEQDGVLSLDFQSNGSFAIRPGIIGFPESWAGFSQLQLEFESDSESRIFVEVFGSRSRLRDTVQLKKGIDQYMMDLREVPLLGGIRSVPSQLKISSEDTARFSVISMSLIGGDPAPFLVDRWGQRAMGQWEGKITTQEQFMDLSFEDDFLDSLKNHETCSPLDRFGGYAGRSVSFAPGGFFRTVKAHGRWWLVTPDGNPFYSMGVNGVRIKSFRSNADVTRISGRENLFESLPSFAEYPICFREDSSYFSFYSWNILRKYKDLGRWKYQTEKRLLSAGFNTIGNWSDTLFYKEPVIPYTYTLDSRNDKSVMMTNGMPDVFHPEWEKHLDRAFSEISRFSDDPYLLGYFVDNEMHWGSILKPDSASYTFRELEKYPTEDERKGVYAERYFSSVHEAILRHDPNHLYMGCRFTRNFRNMEPIATAAGHHVDILSINVYSPYPIREQMDQWYQATGKPMLIGEHHIPPRTGKQLWPRYPNFSPDERDSMVTNYIRTWTSYPYALGSHWYQYKDQEVAGREDGGENQPIGIVTVADQPNYRLLKVYREISNMVPQNLGLESN